MHFTLRLAEISPDKKYRYLIKRTWSQGEGTCLFIMLNPSMADEKTDDPATRKCAAYAALWGYQSFEAVNLFAYRSPYPVALKKASDPIGPDNDHWVLRQAKQAELIVIAWGMYGVFMNRNQEMLKLLGQHDFDLYCISKTKQGHPGHVMYKDAGLKPEKYLRDVY